MKASPDVLAELFLQCGWSSRSGGKKRISSLRFGLRSCVRMKTVSIECNCHEVQTPIRHWRNCAKSDELDYRNVKDCKEKSFKKIYFIVKLRKK